MKYPKLFEPIRIKDTVFRNRILGAPSSTRNKTEWGGATEHEIAYLAAKAKGGAAQITVGETPVDHRYLTQKKSCVLDLTNPACWPGISEMALAIRNYGAVASIQLCHGGAECEPALSDGRNPIGPSSYIRQRDGVQVEEMTQDQILDVIESFGNAAQLAQQCGFEMCMLHGGHGWLLSQFISPHRNHRNDQWGGSVENRARFPLAVIASIRQKCGERFLIEYRISGDEFMEGGMKIGDVLPILLYLDEKVDLIHISAAHHSVMESWERMSPHPMLPNGCNVHLAEQARRVLKTPIVTVGAINSPEQAEQILSSGRADFVSIARGLIADPDFPIKAQSGREEEIIPCARCNHCLGSMAYHGCIVCSVNPKVGRYFQVMSHETVHTPLKVAVVGGGPAGMQAAITAAQRGHTVTLYEKEEQLGGVLRFFEGDPLKLDWCRYRGYMERMTEKLVSVHLAQVATPELLKANGYDVVFAALGASPTMPPIPGIDGSNVHSVLKLHHSEVMTHEKIAILGGGISGCEAAYVLAEAGKQVTLVELLPHIGFQKEDASFVYALPLLLRIERHPNITVYTCARCTEISGDSIAVALESGQVRRIETDAVICATGLKANWKEAESLIGCAEQVIFLGDCITPKRVADATGRAYFAAMNLK